MQSDTSAALYQVSEFMQQAKSLLEGSFPWLWVTGEISNLVTAQSGHVYFTLKDAQAQVRCAFFKPGARRLPFTLQNGQQVVMQARVSLYEARGDFQLIVLALQPAGEGALQLAFLQLKQKLNAEGLFDPARKRPIPAFPKTIGIITSSAGAALRDILIVTQRRSPVTSLVIYPTLVQGTLAGEQIAQMIQVANQRREVDVLLLARGGGSLEDLWAFNEEVVARAIANSALPTVSAIGHETDFTIADFVADLRAPTPSAAAELLTPDFGTWLAQFSQHFRLLQHAARKQLQRLQQGLLNLQQRVVHPQQRLQAFALRTHHLGDRLLRCGNIQLQQAQQHVAHLADKLHTVSPLQTLQRGYAIASDANTRSIVRDASQLQPRDRLIVRFAQGECLAEVVETTQTSV